MGEASATEGENLEFTARLSRASGKTVWEDREATETGDTAETGDYTANSGTLAFAPGGRGKTITVATIADADTDEETFTLTLSGESNVTLAVGQFQTGSGKNMQMLGQLFTGESGSIRHRR